MFAALTECNYGDDFFRQFFVFQRHFGPQAERSDEIFGERQYDDCHFSGTDVHDAQPRVYKTGQWAPEFVRVSERSPIKVELAA